MTTQSQFTPATNLNSAPADSGFVTLTLLIGLLWTITACSKSPTDARTQLAALHMEFTPTAFVHAAQQGDKTAVDLFLAAGMNPNTAQAGMSALLVAAGSGSKDIVESLLQAGADANFTSQAMQGSTPLLLSLVSGDPKGQQRAKDAGRATAPVAPKDLLAIVKMLVKHGAKVDVRDNFGNTPLIVALTIGSPELVEFLVERGASPSFSGMEGTTPLTWASSLGNVSAVKLLLAKGADDTHGDDKGDKPITHARQMGHTEIVKLLEEHAAREVAKLQKVAEAGDLKATVALGVRYMQGAGVPEDPKRALELFSTAAAKGYSWGLCYSGQCYMSGAAGETNRLKGLDLLFQAADQGNPTAVGFLLKEYQEMNQFEEEMSQSLPRVKDLKEFEQYYQSSLAYFEGHWGPDFFGNRDRRRVEQVIAKQINFRRFQHHELAADEAGIPEIERIVASFKKQMDQTEAKEPKPTRIELLLAKLPPAPSEVKTSAPPTKAEFKRGLANLVLPQSQFEKRYGKPDKTQKLADRYYWYYPCADGVVQVVLDADVLDQMKNVAVVEVNEP